MTVIDSVQATEQGLVLRHDQRETLLSWRWVRDHGEDEASFDSTTRQRRIYAIGSEPPVAAVGCVLAHASGQPVVSITWPEAPEHTWITQATLRMLLTRGAPNTATSTDEPVLWSSPQDAPITKGDVSAVLADDSALAAWLHDLAIYGYAMLGGFCGGEHEATTLANRIGYVRETIFGGTWELASDRADHQDTAYSQAFLAPHTDGTYSHDAPGLQMFACVERSGTGGESIVVDAFAIAETLRRDHPEDFEVLTTVSVPAHYIEPGVVLRASRPAIVLDETGAVRQVSMNNYDRSPMLLPPDEMDAFYRAYGRLHDLTRDESRWVSVRLEPGDVLINDNWRVLHGRQAYTGARRFWGCYLNHEDFESRLRTLSLS